MKIIFLNFLSIFFFCINVCTAQKNSYGLLEKDSISYVVSPKGDTIYKFKDPNSGAMVRYTIKEGKLLNERGESIVVEKMPEFPNGEQAMFRFLSTNVRYPRLAREHGAQATIIAGFIVRANGVIDSAHIKDIIKIYYTNSPKKRKKLEAKIPAACYEEMKAETLRLIESMPNWKPGMQQHKPVPVKFTFPIRFKLD
jgi:hypothetical protein